MARDGRRARRKCATVGLLAVGLAAAQVRGEVLLPLRTEDARPLPGGQAALTLGTSWFRDLLFPPFTARGLIARQDLLAAPLLDARIGAGGRVELQASFPMLFLDERATGGETNVQYGPGDLGLFTKVRLPAPGPRWPVPGLRFGVQLPNARRADRLGTDEMVFAGDLLASHAFGPVEAHANVGLALLSIPEPFPYDRFTSEGQDDLFVFRVAAVSPWVPAGTPARLRARLLGEVAGSAGSRFGNDRADVRVAVAAGRPPWTVFAGASTGLVAASETVGIHAGITWALDLGGLAARPEGR